MNKQDLLDTFKAMTLLELSEFLREFEATFNVSAALQAPQLLADPMPAEEEEQQSEFDVVLESPGDKKIQVIKEVRTLTKLGLKEAKDLVDAAPSVILKAVALDQASAAVTKLTDAGARVITR